MMSSGTIPSSAEARPPEIADWQGFLEEISVPDEGVFPRAALIKLVQQFSQDDDPFLRRQGEKLLGCMEDLARGELDRMKFEASIRDMLDITELASRRMSVLARTRAKRYIKDVTALILYGLAKHL